MSPSTTVHNYTCKFMENAWRRKSNKVTEQSLLNFTEFLNFKSNMKRPSGKWFLVVIARSSTRSSDQETKWRILTDWYGSIWTETRHVFRNLAIVTICYNGFVQLWKETKNQIFVKWIAFLCNLKPNKTVVNCLKHLQFGENSRRTLFCERLINVISLNSIHRLISNLFYNSPDGKYGTGYYDEYSISYLHCKIQHSPPYQNRLWH